MTVAGAATRYLIQRLGRREQTQDGHRTTLPVLLSSTMTALIVAAAIDGLLPQSHLWARNSAPPFATGARLIDPVGLFLVGALLALVAAIAARPTTQSEPQAEPLPAT
jgi:hypothetical protein